MYSTTTFLSGKILFDKSLFYSNNIKVPILSLKILSQFYACNDVKLPLEESGSFTGRAILYSGR